MGTVGFEPTTSSMSRKRSLQAELSAQKCEGELSYESARNIELLVLNLLNWLIRLQARNAICVLREIT